MLVFISVVFIVMVLLYMILSVKRLPYLDTLMISLSVIMLIVSLINHKNNIELFTTGSAAASLDKFASLDKLELVSLQEDVQPITKVAAVYLTVHNNKSYPGSGKDFYNVAYDPKKGDNCPDGNNRVFTFENTPTISTSNGVTMNTNRLRGPLSNALSIDVQSTFSIFFTCMHGNFTANEQEIEFFKLYANSSNNNGIVMFIPANSINIEPDSQKARLSIQYIDESIKNCTVNNSQQITFPKTNMMSYFVVKDIDTIKVYSMEGSSTIVTTLLTTTISESTANFSNKEMVINRFRNYRGGIYQFGIIPKTLNVDDVSKIHTHCLNYYTRARSVEFISMTTSYNEMVEYLRNVRGCPFPTETCTACSTITDWTNTSQLVSASAPCRVAIDDFCKKNPTHFRCRCWNTNLPDYNTTSCKMWRGIFMPDKTMFDNLSQDELNYVKTKYALIRPEDCPKPVTPKTSCVNDELIKNTYTEYDFNKIKIDPDSVSKRVVPGSLKTTYGSSNTTQATLSEKRAGSSNITTSSNNVTLRQRRDMEKEQKQGEYNFTPVTLEIKDESALPNKDKDHAYRIPLSASSNNETLGVMNLYQTDPNVNFDASANVAFKEIEKTSKLAESEEPSPFMKSLNNIFFGGL